MGIHITACTIDIDAVKGYLLENDIPSPTCPCEGIVELNVTYAITEPAVRICCPSCDSGCTGVGDNHIEALERALSIWDWSQKRKGCATA